MSKPSASHLRIRVPPSLQVSDDQKGTAQRFIAIDRPSLGFANHIRNRANALVHLLPFPHIYQNVLSAIANIDWQKQHDADRVRDSEAYLAFAKITDNESAVTYLDWLEPKLRNWLSRYEQMLAVHRQELAKLMVTFDRERS